MVFFKKINIAMEQKCAKIAAIFVADEISSVFILLPLSAAVKG
jgi:hypothetical protein